MVVSESNKKSKNLAKKFLLISFFPLSGKSFSLTSTASNAAITDCNLAMASTRACRFVGNSISKNSWMKLQFEFFRARYFSRDDSFANVIAFLGKRSRYNNNVIRRYRDYSIRRQALFMFVPLNIRIVAFFAHRSAHKIKLVRHSWWTAFKIHQRLAPAFFSSGAIGRNFMRLKNIFLFDIFVGVTPRQTRIKMIKVERHRPAESEILSKVHALRLKKSDA